MKMSDVIELTEMEKRTFGTDGTDGSEAMHSPFLGDVMLDIETWGNGHRAAIGTIAAVEFDILTGATGRKFYMNVSLISCMALGLEVDAETVLFWMKQSKEAQEELIKGTSTIEEAMKQFVWWMALVDGERCKIWSRGPSFDIVVVGNALKKLGRPEPWKFTNERDVRTMIDFLPKGMRKANDGQKHHALDDCIHQIELVCAARKFALG